MTSRPASIRNVSWAVVRDGAASAACLSPRRRPVPEGRPHRRDHAGRRASAGRANEPVLDGTGMLALPGLVNIHSHPTTEPGYRGVREDHGVPEQQMTGLIERLQAFRLGDDGRRRAADPRPTREMLRAGTTTACDVTVPFDGWLETMVQQRHALLCRADLRLGALGHERAADRDLEMGRGRRPGRSSRRPSAVMAEAEAHNSGRLDAMVFPAQIDTVTPELFAAGRRHADETGPALLDPYRPVGGRGARDDPPPQHDAGAVGGGAGPAEARHRSWRIASCSTSIRRSAGTRRRIST